MDAAEAAGGHEADSRVTTGDERPADGRRAQRARGDAKPDVPRPCFPRFGAGPCDALELRGSQANDKLAVENGGRCGNRAGGSDARLALATDVEPFPGWKAVRDDRRLERDDRLTRAERPAHLLGDPQHRSSMSTNSTSPNSGNERTCLPVSTKPARSYTLIARSLNAATASTIWSGRNCSRPNSRPARTNSSPCPWPARSGRSPSPYSRTGPLSSK